jgi:putative sterol carrier protein
MSARASPESFFDGIVPTHLRQVTVPKDAQHTFVFRLFGDSPGEWSIDLAKRRVRRGGLARPDLYVEMDRADFSALLDGELDAPAAVAAGRVRFIGNITFLADLGRMLQPQIA